MSRFDKNWVSTNKNKSPRVPKVKNSSPEVADNKNKSPRVPKVENSSPEVADNKNMSPRVQKSRKFVASWVLHNKIADPGPIGK